MMNTNADSIYLGIDGGGSNCRARLRNHRGRLLAEGRAGPANLRLGANLSQEQILLCTQQALQRAGLHDYPLSQLHAGIGLAGAVLAEDIQAAQPIRALFASCQLSHDAHIACMGAHLGAPGGIVIVGTGSCAQIVSPAINRTYGGWGFEISDHASGAWLGRSALSQTLQSMEDMRPASSLYNEIAQYFEWEPAQVLRWCGTAKPADYAKFAPQVFAHSDNGDATAITLVQDGCDELTRLIGVLEKNTQNICLLGGLAENYRRHLSADAQLSLCAARSDALDGALLMAGLPADSLDQP